MIDRGKTPDELVLSTWQTCAVLDTILITDSFYIYILLLILIQTS